MNIVILGAGNKGIALSNLINRKYIKYFADNDERKIGKIINDIECISYDSMLGMADKLTVVLSVDNEELRSRLHADNVTFYEADMSKNSFFCTEEYKRIIDTDLLRKYDSADYSFWEDVYRNEKWYRSDYYSDNNRILVEAMRKGDDSVIKRILRSIYKDNHVYYDELFENRPGMRLIYNLIVREKKNYKTVCDIACGHGDFLRQLYKNSIECIGIDSAPERIDYIKKWGGKAYVGDVEQLQIDCGSMDCCVAMECLEHVKDPYVVMKEINRVLRKCGKIYITTPYGTNCDCEGHVRQIYERDLYDLAINNGFTNVKILRIPYLNNEMDNNLIMVAEKKEECV